MRLIDDYKVKAEAYLYWIKSSKMKDTAVLPKKGDYVVVFHYWFVHSLGWETFTFTGLTYDEVLTKTMMIKERKENNFCRCSYKIIEVDIG